jgi:cytoskeletal protein RodZ
MKSVGEVIKEARIKKKLSREKLEVKTKIKREFIEALEDSKWDALPEYPVVFGFVKNIAGVLGLNKANLTALLRRDYPPKTLRVNPKPEMREKFKWGPKATFATAMVFVLMVVFVYLGVSYLNFIKPPYLELQEPVEGQLVEKNVLSVRGKTNPEVFVKVNNQPVLVGEEGYFETEIEIFEGTEEVEVVARSRSGKETVVRRKIEVNLGNSD